MQESDSPPLGVAYEVTDTVSEDDLLIEGQTLVPIDVVGSEVIVEYYDDPELEDGTKVPWEITNFQEYIDNGVLQQE